MELLIVDHRELFAIAAAYAVEGLAANVHQATRWETATRILSSRPVAALLLNLSFEEGGKDALQLLEIIQRTRPRTPVVVISTSADPLARDGAEILELPGYVHLELTAEEFCEAVATVARGGRWWAEVPGPAEGFSAQELVVLRLLRLGHDRDGIRAGLHARMGDAERWLDALAEKLGTSDLQEMVAEASAKGLYDIPPLPRLIEEP